MPKRGTLVGVALWAPLTPLAGGGVSQSNGGVGTNTGGGREPTMASEHTLKITDGDFDQTVLQADTPVLVDFWAEWCGPCRMVAPAIEGLADEYSGRVAVGKLNIDENPNTQTKYGVRSIPTLLLFKDGEVVEATVGVLGKDQLAELLDKHLTPATA